MTGWPDKDGALAAEFVNYLKLFRFAGSHRAYRSLLRRFQSFVTRRALKRQCTEAVFRAWLKEELKTLPLPLAVHYGRVVSRFLDWLVKRGAIAGNPIAELRRKYECRSTAPILSALAGPRHKQVLESLRPLPRYGSHIGSIIRKHVERMRTLGLRYRQENRFLHFDRFLQQRQGADREPLDKLIREYVSDAGSAAMRMQRIDVCRAIAKELNRRGEAVTPPRRDRMMVQEMIRSRRRPTFTHAKR